MTPEEQADNLLSEVIIDLDGFNPTVATQIIKDALEALATQTKALKDIPFKTDVVLGFCSKCKKGVKVEVPARPETVAKTMAVTAKVIDETARLLQFLQGRPDSRREVRQVEWLQALTKEQLATVQSWIDANGK